MSKNPRNNFKEIKLTLTSDPGTSWRDNLRRMINEGVKGTSILKNSPMLATTVATVPLLLDSGKFLGNGNFEFKNKTEKAVSQLLNNAEDLGKTVLSFSKKGTALATLGRNLETTTGLSNKAAVFNPWFRNIPAYDPSSISAIEFNYTFNFALGQYGLWDAREEVVLPILNLIAPTLPRALDSGFITPPFPTALGLLSQILGKLFSGEGTETINSVTSAFQDWTTSLTGNWGTITAAWAGEGALSAAKTTLGTVGKTVADTATMIAELLGGVLNSEYKNYTFTVTFGNFVTFNNMLITGSSFNFSSETDTEGFPISGNCTLTFKGITPAALRSSLPEGMQPGLTFGV